MEHLAEERGEDTSVSPVHKETRYFSSRRKRKENITLKESYDSLVSEEDKRFPLPLVHFIE